MACKCKSNQQAPVTVMSGGFVSPTTYIITPSSDEMEQKQTITSSGASLIIQRGGNKQTLTPNTFSRLRISEVTQLLEQKAPIYAYN